MGRHPNALTGRLFYVYGGPSDYVYTLGKALGRYLGCEHIDLAFISSWPADEKLLYIKQKMPSGCVISGNLKGWGEELYRHIDYAFEVLSRSTFLNRPLSDCILDFQSWQLFTEDSPGRHLEIMTQILSIILD